MVLFKWTSELQNVLFCLQAKAQLAGCVLALAVALFARQRPERGLGGGRGPEAGGAVPRSHRGTERLEFTHGASSASSCGRHSFVPHTLRVCSAG